MESGSGKARWWDPLPFIEILATALNKSLDFNYSPFLLKFSPWLKVDRSGNWGTILLTAPNG